MGPPEGVPGPGTEAAAGKAEAEAGEAEAGEAGEAEAGEAAAGEAGEAAAAEAGARARLEVLFAAFDRLTPDELAHIGFRMAPDTERDQLLGALGEAARRTGRVALVDQARGLAQDAVMRRYADGAYHPTMVALNWGLSQGPVEDRVAIAEILADAAAAAVVEDALDPEVARAFALDAAHIVGLSAGNVSEASLARAIHVPDDPELRPPRGVIVARSLIIGLLVVVAVLGVGIGWIALAVAAGIGAAVLGMRAARSRG